MYRFLFLLLVLLNAGACKKTKAGAAAPAPSLSGELHYRKFCTTGTRAPIVASPPPTVYLTGTDGQLVASPVNVIGGRFHFPRIPTTGTLALHTFTWGSTAFYANGATHASLPVTIRDTRAHSAGKLCVDNDPPVIERLFAEYSVGITSAVDSYAHINLPRHAGLVRLLAEVSDPDQDTYLEWTFASPDGVIQHTDGQWTWDLSAVQNSSTTLHLVARDGRGGQTDRFINVRLYDNVLYPKQASQPYQFKLAGDRALMEKSLLNTTGRWSFSECCLVAVQYEPTVPNRLEAKAPLTLFSGTTVTAETAVAIYSLNSDVSFGLRLTDAASSGNYLDALLSAKDGKTVWSLGNDHYTIRSGVVAEPLVGGTFYLKLSYSPIDLEYAFEVTSASGAITGTTFSMYDPVFTMVETSLIVNNRATNNYGATYLGFTDLKLHGSNPARYELPVTPGEFNDEVYDDGIFESEQSVHVYTADGEFAGYPRVKLPIWTALHRALLAMPDGRRVTILTDDKERVLAWMPQGSILYKFDWEVVAPTAVEHVFLY
jgi:hypothetical protein